MKKHRKYKKVIMAFATVLLLALIVAIGLYKTGIYRFDFLKDIYKKVDFQLSTNELSIPQDALSFSVYDIEDGEYLFTRVIASCPLSQVWQNYLLLIMLWKKRIWKILLK